MSRETNARISEWARWYHEQLSNGVLKDHANVENQIRFFKVAVDGCLELIARQAHDIQRLERANRPEIILPSGVKLHDPIRERESGEAA